jgi:hypothetical protein
MRVEITDDGSLVVEGAVLPPAPTLADKVLSLAAVERRRQDVQWGEQNHPLGTGAAPFKALAETYRKACQDAADRGECTWAHIALEEFFEALAEDDPAKFAHEAIQTIAVLSAAVECLLRADPNLTLPPPF